MRGTTTILSVIIVLNLASCRQRKDGRVEDDGLTTAFSPLSYEEGDTLQVNLGQAPNLEEWMGFYTAMDSSWRTTRFLASGVNIHIDSMEGVASLSAERMEAFAPLMSWSPDSSLCIDLWSYNRLIEKALGAHKMLVGGGPDQLVALSDRSGTVRRQVMFNGPMQVAEAVDWISPDAFLIGMLNIDEPEGTVVPEILLFNLSDTLYTNFRYPGTFRLDAVPGGEGGFVERWLKGRGFILQ